MLTHSIKLIIRDKYHNNLRKYIKENLKKYNPKYLKMIDRLRPAVYTKIVDRIKIKKVDRKYKLKPFITNIPSERKLECLQEI